MEQGEKNEAPKFQDGSLELTGRLRDASTLTACHTWQGNSAAGRTMWGPMMDFVDLVSAKDLAGSPRDSF